MLSCLDSLVNAQKKQITKFSLKSEGILLKGKYQQWESSQHLIDFKARSDSNDHHFRPPAERRPRNCCNNWGLKDLSEM